MKPSKQKPAIEMLVSNCNRVLSYVERHIKEYGLGIGLSTIPVTASVRKKDHGFVLVFHTENKEDLTDISFDVSYEEGHFSLDKWVSSWREGELQNHELPKMKTSKNMKDAFRKIYLSLTRLHFIYAYLQSDLVTARVGDVLDVKVKSYDSKRFFELGEGGIETQEQSSPKKNRRKSREWLKKHNHLVQGYLTYCKGVEDTSFDEWLKDSNHLVYLNYKQANLPIEWVTEFVTEEREKSLSSN